MKKLYYSIGEVSKLIEEEQHILRYWEKEFPQLRPKKNRGGNRSYSKNDLSTLKAIKRLIREEKLPISEAKKRLTSLIERKQEKKLRSASTKSNANKSPQTIEKVEEKGISNSIAIDKNALKQVYTELSSILEILKSI
ncbi:MAG: MerR family transcriptional regulator [Ignavibacteria bacterium]|nr:MerR family transcriptional regulator [Ignavibacteria bacterium]